MSIWPTIFCDAEWIEELEGGGGVTSVCDANLIADKATTPPDELREDAWIRGWTTVDGDDGPTDLCPTHSQGREMPLRQSIMGRGVASIPKRGGGRGEREAQSRGMWT